MQFPKLTGKIEIREEQGKIEIGGDPEGLRSLAQLMAWLADADQETWPYLPAGQGAHLHIYPGIDISEGSQEVEIKRLDVKGAGRVK